MNLIKQIFNFPIVALVKIYQWFISPIIPKSCRYTPTCSTYILDALRVWGPIKGLYLGIKRILSCNPWGGHGHDSVPQRKK